MAGSIIPLEVEDMALGSENQLIYDRVLCNRFNNLAYVNSVVELKRCDV